MKITITGSTGNISKPLARKLVDAGHEVTVISNNVDRRADIEASGATAAIGSVKDRAFLTAAFTGADAVYTMVPPDLTADNLRQYFAGIGQSYADAIEKAGVQRVVNLSSMGAHLSIGTGMILGARDVENSLNKLENAAVKHLRASLFFINFYNNIDMVRQLGIMGSNYPAGTKLLMVHPEDVAAAAAAEIQQGFTGKSVRYVVSDERTAGEVASVLGAAIGIPDLPWVEFSDEQALNGMMQGGMRESVAKLFVEVGAAVRSGKLWEDYRTHKNGTLGSWKLEAFAKVFAERFK